MRQQTEKQEYVFCFPLKAASRLTSPWRGEYPRQRQAACCVFHAPAAQEPSGLHVTGCTDLAALFLWKIRFSKCLRVVKLSW